MNAQKRVLKTHQLRLIVIVLCGVVCGFGLYASLLRTRLVTTELKYRAAQEELDPNAREVEAAVSLAWQRAEEAQHTADQLRDAQSRYTELERKYQELQAQLKKIEGPEGGARSRATMQQTLEEFEALLEPIKDVIKDDRPLGGPPSPARWEELIKRERR